MTRLHKRCSPEQISHDLRKCFPDNENMQPCTETIYQAIYVQSKGHLCKELVALIRRGKTQHKTALTRTTRRRFHDPIIMISEHPVEVQNHSNLRHWKEDLIIGKKRQEHHRYPCRKIDHVNRTASSTNQPLSASTQRSNREENE
ncbi:hypothetical protein [Alloscardovia omnicolens]|uniref:hypothetical protein n=1 Tax=Alloscardovia omnicolens TaxID=419015 RepID=UPI003A64268C